MKLIDHPCPHCGHGYRYEDDDGSVWCPHCAETDPKEIK